MKNFDFSSCSLYASFLAILINEDVEVRDGHRCCQAIDSMELGVQNRKSQLLFAYERRKIVRNKWNLFYTLVNNPDLVKYRKNKRNADEEGNDDEDDQLSGEKSKGNSSFYD